MSPEPTLRVIKQDEFSSHIEPLRKELLAHCYRFMGSIQDSEDMLQETLLRAWKQRAGFEGKGTFRSWMYRIATNVCLDSLKKRPKRSIPNQSHPPADPNDPFPAPSLEPIWLEPIPDEMLPDERNNPETRYSNSESISLAFITALHLLPPQQRSVLILRDVLDWKAKEVADLLGQSLSAVNSALYRARVTMAKNYHKKAAVAATEITDDEPLLAQFVDAWEKADIELFTNLLKESAEFTMPPFTCWYFGRNAIRTMVTWALFDEPEQGRWKLTPTRANGQPAFGLYQREKSSEAYQAFGVLVLTIDKDEIAGITAFLTPALFPNFKLPVNI